MRELPPVVNVNSPADMKARWSHCERAAWVFRQVVKHAERQDVRARAGPLAVRVDELIDLLKDQIAALSVCGGGVWLDPRTAKDRIAWCRHQHHAIRRSVAAHQELAVYDQDIDSLQMFAAAMFGAGPWTYKLSGTHLTVEKWTALAQAVVQERWKHADDPLAYVAKVSRTIAPKDAKVDAPFTLRNHTTRGEEDTVPLDGIEGTPAEAGDAGVAVERVHSFDALRDEARRRGDLEVTAYIDGLEMATAQGLDPKAAHRQTRKQMGWDKFAASKIRGRFYRLRDAAAGDVVRGAVSDASRNVFWETFYDGKKGREHGTWTHKKPAC